MALEKDIKTVSIVPDSSDLEDKEGYAVDMDGDLCSDSTKGCLGAVYEGRPSIPNTAGTADQDEPASVIAVKGIMDVQVDVSSGTQGTIVVGDPLTAGGGTAGHFEKAQIGTDLIRGYAREASSGTASQKIQAYLI